MNRRLECGSESSSTNQEDANVQRDLNVQGLGDLQKLLMTDGQARAAVVRKSRRMLVSVDSRSYQRISIPIPRGEASRNCS